MDSFSWPTKREHTSTSVRLQNSQYISAGEPAFRVGAASDNSSAELRHVAQTKYKLFTLKINLKNAYSASEDWNYLDLHELYGEARMARTALSLGRKLDTWSEWDKEWNQGVFQPRYLANKARAESAGLSGVFLHQKGDRISATLGWLPVFIPDFGPGFDVQNNEFVSKNPWFESPATRFQLGESFGPIHYAVNKPSAEEVALRHPGVVAKVEFRAQQYLSRLTYAYKPMAQLLLGFPSKGKLRIENSGSHMDIVINPRVLYDRVVSWDHQYTSSRWGWSASTAYDNPENDRGPDDFTTQQVTSASIFAASVTRLLEQPGPHAALLRVGFLKVSGGDAPDRGEFAGESTLFERRYQFYEAYMLAFKKEFRSWFQAPFQTEVRLIYDRLQDGGLVSFNSGVDLFKTWRVDVEMDFLGLFSSNAAIRDGFFDSFRANNRMGLGVSYVF